MTKLLLNKLSIILYFIISAILLEIVSFHFLDLGFLPSNFLYDLSIILVIALLIFAIPNYIVQYIISILILLVQVILIYTNYSLYTIYGDIFSFDMFYLLKEATAAVTSSFVYFRVILQLVAIYLIMAVIGYIILQHCRKHKINIKNHFSLIIIIIFFIVQCFSLTYISSERIKIQTLSDIDSENYIYSDEFLLNTQFLKAGSYAKFGTYGYYLNMIMNINKTADKYTKDATIDYFNSGNIYDSSEVFGVDYNNVTGERNNVIVIMMESIEWYCFGNGLYDESVENLSPEFTPNIYSLIYGDEYLTDGSNTNRSNDSLFARNFFSKNKTNLSEGLGIIGYYPVADHLKSTTDKDNPNLDSFGYSMPNVLSKLGYTTSYIHSNKINFYDRDETHSSLGFDYVIGKDNVKDKDGKYVYTGDDLRWGRWDNEGEFAKNAIDYIIPTNYNEKPFYSFYLNVSSHGAYNEESNKYDKDVLKYYNLIKYGANNCDIDADTGYYVPNKSLENKLQNGDKLTREDYSNFYNNVCDSYADTYPEICEEIVYYMCGAKGLDDAVGVIVDKLKEYNIYDKTTILLYSDHNAYYDNLSNNFKNIPVEDTKNYNELYSVPMIISSPGLKKYNKNNGNAFIDNYRFCSAYDIIPTLFDLLGIKFNENLYVGHSLFKPLDYYYIDNSTGEKKDMVVFYSNTGGMFCKDAYTYDLSEIVFENENVDKQQLILYFKAECSVILRKLNYIAIMTYNNLYNDISVK